jgi:hypothetical protein
MAGVINMKKTGKPSFSKKLTVGVADNMMQNSVNMMSNQVLDIYLGVNPALNLSTEAS